MIDAFRYEWVRLTSVRSTYWLLGFAALLQLAVAVLIAWAVTSADGVDSVSDEVFGMLATSAASLGILAPLVVSYLLVMIGILAFGHEYRYGTIRATLTALPSRVNVFVAKVLITGAVAVTVAIFCVLTAVLSMAVFGIEMPSGDAFRRITLGVGIYLVLFTWWGLAVAALVRNQTIAVAVALLVPTAGELLIKSILFAYRSASGDRGSTGVVEIAKFLPFDAGSRMYTDLSVGRVFGIEPFGTVGGGVVMATFVALLLAWAGLWFIRKDA